MAHFVRIGASAALLSIAAVAGASPYAYVSNEGSGTISVVDVASDRVSASTPPFAAVYASRPFIPARAT